MQSKSKRFRSSGKRSLADWSLYAGARISDWYSDWLLQHVCPSRESVIQDFCDPPGIQCLLVEVYLAWRYHPSRGCQDPKWAGQKQAVGLAWCYQCTPNSGQTTIVTEESPRVAKNRGLVEKQFFFFFLFAKSPRSIKYGLQPTRESVYLHWSPKLVQNIAYDSCRY